MSVDMFIDEIEETLEGAWGVPLSNGKVVVDSEKLFYLLDKIKASLPNEIKQARLIVSDRSDIIDDAKKEAEAIIRAAEDKAKIMLDQDELVKQAKVQAADIIMQAQTKAKDIRKTTDEYIGDTLKRADELLTANLSDFRKVRKDFQQ